MAAEKPLCQRAARWIAERLGAQALAPLTGQDSRALRAFVHLVELYGNSDRAGRDAALEAMSSVLRAMQPSTRHLAKASIPCVLDWSDEDRIWALLTGAPAADQLVSSGAAAPEVRN